MLKLGITLALIAFSYEAFVGDIYVNDYDDSIMLVSNLGVADDVNVNQEEIQVGDENNDTCNCQALSKEMKEGYSKLENDLTEAKATIGTLENKIRKQEQDILETDAKVTEEMKGIKEGMYRLENDVKTTIGKFERKIKKQGEINIYLGEQNSKQEEQMSAHAYGGPCSRVCSR